MVKGQASAVTHMWQCRTGRGEEVRAGTGEDCHSTRQARSPSHVTDEETEARGGEALPQDHPPPKSVSQVLTRAMDTSLSSSHQQVPGGSIGRNRRAQRDQGRQATAI